MDDPNGRWVETSYASSFWDDEDSYDIIVWTSIEILGVHDRSDFMIWNWMNMTRSGIGNLWFVRI